MATFTRVTARGQVRYKARVRRVVNGATVTRDKTLPTLTDAKQWARRVEAELDKQDAGLVTEASRHTLTDAFERYERDVLPELADETRRKYHHHLQHWRDTLGAVRLSELAPARLDEARDALLASGKSAATTNRYLATLGSVLTAAVERWHWIERSPLRAVAKPPEARGRTRFLSRDEVARLLTACGVSTSPDLYPAVLLSLTTGARAGEVMRLQWKHVDLDRGVVLVPTTKNGDPRVLALVPEAIEILKARARDHELVFPDLRTAGRPIRKSDKAPDEETPIRLRRAWVTALKRAGIADFKWHDMRHSVASFLAARGASLKQIGEVLGHRSVNTTARYAHLTQDHAHQLVRDMAADVLPEKQS